MPAYEHVLVSSVADAVAIIRQRYPQADGGTNLQYELGEREDGASRWRTCGGRGSDWTGRSTVEFVPTVKQVVPANVRSIIERSENADATPSRRGKDLPATTAVCFTGAVWTLCATDVVSPPDAGSKLP